MTQIKTKIPAEMEPASVGGMVTDSKYVIDRKRNKTQTEINTETEERVFTLDGNIALEKQRAEGIESGLNNRLSTVEQLAEISIGGGDAQIATGADFTNPNATKRAKIPTVGAIVDGLNDGIYDVSKRNPSGGPNSDGKFTLEYILSNANTLIPTGWRHGGMTISFVDSSDNKYVQCRLMLSTFTAAQFTNVANWQGVDDEPTANSENLVKSGGVASIMMKHGLINKFDKSKVIFGIDELHPVVTGWKIPTLHSENGIKYERIYFSTAINTTSVLFGGTDTKQINSGVCTIAIRAKSSSHSGYNVRIYIYKENSSSFITAPAFSVVNSEFKDYYYTFTTNSVFKITLEPTLYQDLDISKIYVYDGSKEDCLLDYISDDYTPKKITTNLLTELKPYRYDNKWNANRNNKQTDLIEIPDSGIMTCYGFRQIPNQSLKVYLFNSDKEYVTYIQILLGLSLQFLKINTSLYKYMSIGNNNQSSTTYANGFICEGWYPWIENEELSSNLQNLKVPPTKLYPAGKNKVSVIGKDIQFVNAAGTMTYIYNSGWIATSMIDIKEAVDICISGVPEDDFSAITIHLLAADHATVLKTINLSRINNEYVFINPNAEALVVSMQYSNEDYDLSEFQIEFNSKKTSFEATVFGIKEIYGIPFVSDSKGTQIEYPEIGTTFIFGDSITATNTNSVLMGDPEEYTNSITTISYVPALMSKLGITSWYNFALGGAIWRDIQSTKEELGDFAWMSTQVDKAISFSNESGKVPSLILIAMGANDGFTVPSGSTDNAESEFYRVMYGENPATFGYSGIALENLDRTMLAEAIRYNMHRIEAAFPKTVKMVILPIQASNCDYIVGGKQKREIIRLMANAYGMECIDGYAQTGIVKQFETKKENETFVGPFRDLQDQVHPNINGQMKEVRLYANKIRSRFLY